MRPRLYDLAYIVLWPLREAGAVQPTADQWRWLVACCTACAAASSDPLLPSDWNAFIWLIAMLPVLGIAVATHAPTDRSLSSHWPCVRWNRRIVTRRRQPGG